MSTRPTLISLLTVLLTAAVASADGNASGNFHALLIGVTRYPNLDETYHLKGPANDVQLMAKLLQDRYGFLKENVRILSEDFGPERLPTRKNIEEEFIRLAEKVQAGDRVVVLLGGHGSLQPQGPSSRFFQPDGFDRIFLPRDVQKWDGGRGEVPNAIRGEELGAWLRPIPEKKAFLWVILDACHSGQGVRGVDDEQKRQIDPDAKGGLEIPREALRQAEKRAVERRDGQLERARGEQEIQPLPNLEGVTVLYACLSSETTVERRLPAGAPDSKPYGLLTFTVYQTLTQADAPLTYLELAQRIQGHYVTLGRHSPTPVIEGKDRNREVIGLKEHPRRSLIRLFRSDEDLKITAGTIQGMTEGSILAVFPPAGQKQDKPLGYVRVSQVESASAQVTPCDFKDQKAQKDLPVNGRCEVVVIDYGDMKLKVAVDPLDNQGNAIPETDRQRVAKVLSQMSAEENSLLAAVADAGKASWLVRVQSGKSYLIPASGFPAGPGKLPALFGPFADEALKERLFRIARADNLKKLACESLVESSRGSAGSAADRVVRVNLEIRRLMERTDKKGQPVDWPDPNLKFYHGDRFRFAVHNPNPYPVDVTLLYVDSDYGIDPLYPRAGEDNRLEPKATLPIPAPIKVTGGDGLEHLVIIAVKAKSLDQKVDFSSLAQDSLEKAMTKERTRGGAGASRTPLGQLLQHSLYGKGTRSVGMEECEDSSLSLYSWRIVPGKRP
jgi:hypothetical protein